MNQEVMAIAEAQAEKDAQLLDDLRARELGMKATNEAVAEYVDAEEALRPLNRAERRAAVKQFAANLRALPRAAPVRNATIKRRKRR